MRAAIDDNILIKDRASTAGSDILSGFVPPFNSNLTSNLAEAGDFDVIQTLPPEFGMSLTGRFGCVAAVASGEADVGFGCDVMGAVRRDASKSGVYFIKPTYGTVSRYGLVSTSPSMEQIGVAFKDFEKGSKALEAAAGPDLRDGAMDNTKKRAFSASNVNLDGMKICVLPSEDDTKNFASALEGLGASVEAVDFPLLEYVPAVAYIITAAEASNSISRFDGIKYGYRPDEYKSYEDIYVKSRTGCFTFETKLMTLAGMLVLTKEKKDEFYYKSLKVRRLIKNEIYGILERFDAILTQTATEGEGDFFNAYKDLKYLALANLTGLPALAVPGGRQFMAAAGREDMLLGMGKRLQERGAAL